MGQRSLMPGQCPGLPGFGYATACILLFTINWAFIGLFPSMFSTKRPLQHRKSDYEVTFKLQHKQTQIAHFCHTVSLFT